MEYQKYSDLAMAFIAKYAINVVVAVLIIVVGLWLTEKVVKISKTLLICGFS